MLAKSIDVRGSYRKESHREGRGGNKSGLGELLRSQAPLLQCGGDSVYGRRRNLIWRGERPHVEKKGTKKKRSGGMGDSRSRGLYEVSKSWTDVYRQKSESGFGVQAGGSGGNKTKKKEGRRDHQRGG